MRNVRLIDRDGRIDRRTGDADPAALWDASMQAVD
jgi:hypothetical protein